MTEVTEPLWLIATALVAVLIVAWIFGGIARWVLRGRARLSTATSIVLSILGSAIGLLIAGFIGSPQQFWSLLTIGLTLVCSIVAIAIYSAVAAHFQRPQPESVPQLLAGGESDRVEFKSTARVNLHTGEKDARMELTVVKTVAAFLNSDGGTLLIGVDDEGTPLGLAADLQTLKKGDADRFELWLRDLFTTSLGQTSAAEIDVDIQELAVSDDPDERRLVCRVGCSPSPRPVYLRPGKNSPPEFWVRSGNSTRQLSVDQAADYVMHRWPLGLGPGIAAQLKAAARF